MAPRPNEDSVVIHGAHSTTEARERFHTITRPTDFIPASRGSVWGRRDVGRLGETVDEGLPGR
jgi:hypothetical protein